MDVKKTQRLVQDNEIAVVLHLYYPDLWFEIDRYLSNLKDFDLYVSFCNECREMDWLARKYPNARIFLFPNKGRDILPFVRINNLIKDLDYRYICKIHSKKSKHLSDGVNWRRSLLNNLLNHYQELLAIFEDSPSVGMIVPQKYLYSCSQHRQHLQSNKDAIEMLAKQLNIGTMDYKFKFPAGSMFWTRGKLLNNLTSILTEDMFPPESNQLDGTLAHSVERMFGLVVAQAKMEVLGWMSEEDKKEAEMLRIRQEEERIRKQQEEERKKEDLKKKQERAALLGEFRKKKRWNRFKKKP